MKALIIMISLLLVSCQSKSMSKADLESMLDKNPDIILNWVDKHGDKFMEKLQQLAMKRQQAQQAAKQKQEQQSLEDQIKNPLKVDIDRNRVLGNPDAPIILVEYSDFECPFCQRGARTVNELKKKYGDKIAFVYKHLPLDFHKNAMPTALAFEAILQQDKAKAYKFHDIIFERQGEMKTKGSGLIDEIASTLNIDMKKMKEDMKSEKVRQVVDKHMAEARKFGIQGTPGFLLNGVAIKGAYPTQYFDNLIKKMNIK